MKASKLWHLVVAGALVAPLVALSSGAENAGAATRRYTFVDVAEPSGVLQEVRTWGAAWTDYDDDGWPDLFLGRHWRTPRMFLNRRARFRRLKAQEDLQGTQMDRHQCVWGEADGDGHPDLYCVQGADKGTGAGPNQLLLYRDGNLVDRAHAFGVTNYRGRGRTANWLDFDVDGDLDLFVGNTTRPGFPNVLYEQTPGDFRRVVSAVSEEIATVSSSWSDWDRDGDPDLLVLSHAPGKALAYENRRGTFRRVHLRHITGRHWDSAAWGDFDGDGWTDVHLVTRKHSVVLRNIAGIFRVYDRTDLIQGRMSAWLDVENDGDLDLFVVQGARGNYPSPDAVNRPDFLLVKRARRFIRVTNGSMRGPETGNGDSVSIADYNRDGRLDVFVTNGLYYWAGPTELLENTTEAGNWVGIELRGPRRNPFGYGARVVVRTEGMVLRREITDAATFRAQSEVGYVHFGLGREPVADVHIKWPDGTIDCIIAAAGTVVRAEHGTFPCG